jgi:hypothetical protein
MRTGSGSRAHAPDSDRAAPSDAVTTAASSAEIAHDPSGPAFELPADEAFE